MQLKIGQIMTCQKDFTIDTEISNTKLNIKKGDKCIVRSDKVVKYLNGEASGKLQALSQSFEVRGYDIDGITKQIIKELRWSLPLDEMMEDYHIEEEEVQDAIFCALRDILQ